MLHWPKSTGEVVTPTLFSLLIKRCGMSQADAVKFLKVRPDTVASWASGRRSVPDRVLIELKELAAFIQNVAAADADLFNHFQSKKEDGFVLKFKIAQSDEEALEYGWPTASAQHAYLGAVISLVEGPCDLIS